MKISLPQTSFWSFSYWHAAYLITSLPEYLQPVRQVHRVALQCPRSHRGLQYQAVSSWEVPHCQPARKRGIINYLNACMRLSFVLHLSSVLFSILNTDTTAQLPHLLRNDCWTRRLAEEKVDADAAGGLFLPQPGWMWRWFIMRCKMTIIRCPQIVLTWPDE